MRALLLLLAHRDCRQLGRVAQCSSPSFRCCRGKHPSVHRQCKSSGLHFGAGVLWPCTMQCHVLQAISLGLALALILDSAGTCIVCYQPAGVVSWVLSTLNMTLLLLSTSRAQCGGMPWLLSQSSGETWGDTLTNQPETKWCDEGFTDVTSTELLVL